MSRRARTPGQRAARTRSDAARPARAATRTPKRQPADAMTVYRGLASPPLGIRWTLVLGLALFTVAQITSALSPRSVNAPQAMAAAGVLCVTVFLGSGFIRHYRALYRIRRDSPGAWQPTMGFALASLAVPLGFGGGAADARERLVRRVTLLMLVAFAASAILGAHGTLTAGLSISTL